MTTPSQETMTETILRRDHWVVIGGLCVLTLCSWAYVFAGAGTGMNIWAMTTWSFPPPPHAEVMADWSVTYWGIMLAMWWVMMIAMMTPSAAPMVLLYARVTRHAQRKGRKPSRVIPTATFLCGYLSVWLAFSMAATGLQWSLEYFGLVHGMLMWSVSRPLSGFLLIAAGLYQFSAFKSVCLEHCRSPAEYLSRHWHDGQFGALRMGIIHGAYCFGCCWVLMILLFVGGAMNLVWIAGLAILVLVEKLAPFGHRLATAVGAVMIVAGIRLLIT